MSERRVENGKDPETSNFKTIIRKVWTPVALCIE